MKNHLLNNTIVLLFIASLFLSCQGKQGDPGPAGKNGTNGTNGTNGANGTNGNNGATGPQGPPGSNPSNPFVNGAFKALVSGTTQNGKAFTDSINFPYATGYEFFTTTGSVSTLVLYRTQFFEPSNSGGPLMASFQMNLNVSNLGGINQIVNSASTSLTFNKISQDTILNMHVNGPFLTTHHAIYPIDPNSSTYQFQFNIHDPSIFFYSALPDTIFFLQTTFMTKAGDMVYYNNPQTSNGLFVKIVSAQGVTSTTSATYGALHLVAHVSTTAISLGTSSDYFTFSNASNTNLSKIVPILPDTYSITNFVYVPSTANLSFNFTLNSGILSNSTGKSPTTMSGKFSGTVYWVIVD